MSDVLLAPKRVPLGPVQAEKLKAVKRLTVQFRDVNPQLKIVPMMQFIPFE